MSVVDRISPDIEQFATAGRIRIGEKTAKGGPTSIDTFRFTSADKAAIERLAEIYGGTPRPWDDERAGEWQVKTEANSIRVALPPDALGGGALYEHWQGGICVRRCDGGEVADAEWQGCQITQNGDMHFVDCICRVEGALLCKPKSRLSVFLPELSLAGVWRLDSGSWHSFKSWPKMVRLVHMLQGAQISEARLNLSQQKRRLQKKNGDIFTAKSMIVSIDAGASLDDIIAGKHQLGSGSAEVAVQLASDVKEIEAAPDPREPVDEDTWLTLKKRGESLPPEAQEALKVYAKTIGVDRITRSNLTMSTALSLLAWHPEEDIVDAEIVDY